MSATKDAPDVSAEVLEYAREITRVGLRSGGDVAQYRIASALLSLSEQNGRLRNVLDEIPALIEVKFTEWKKQDSLRDMLDDISATIFQRIEHAALEG